MKIRGLTPAERRLRRAFQRGHQAHFGSAEPTEGASWGPERTIRAMVLRTLLLGETTGESALRLSGARITGGLDLRNATIGCPIVFDHCYFEEAPNFYAAQTRQLAFTGSVLPGLIATEIHTSGALQLSGCRIAGTVRLIGARLGALSLDHARLGSGEGEVLQLNPARIEHDLWAHDLHAFGELQLDRARIGGELNLRDAKLSHRGGVCLSAVNATVDSRVAGSRLHATGEVRLTSARIAGSLLLDDAVLANAGGNALMAPGLRVGFDVRCPGIKASGEVRFRGAQVDGVMIFVGVTLCQPGGVALRADGCTAAVLSLKRLNVAAGSVDLRRSRFDRIDVPHDAWPEKVRLDGLTYGALAPRLPAKKRLAVLKRDEDGYVPHAYEQLALAYTRVGDDFSARRVRLAKQRRLRSTLPRWARVWGSLQDVTTGYGYRPVLAAAWLGGLLLVGSVVFGLHHPPPLDPGKTPVFNPVVYTLNLLVPIVDFGQAKAFNPQGWYQWLSYAFIVAGWVLATTVIAGVTRTINRQ